MRTVLAKINCRIILDHMMAIWAYKLTAYTGIPEKISGIKRLSHSLYAHPDKIQTGNDNI